MWITWRYYILNMDLIVQNFDKEIVTMEMDFLLDKSDYPT